MRSAAEAHPTRRGRSTSCGRRRRPGSLRRSHGLPERSRRWCTPVSRRIRAAAPSVPKRCSRCSSRSWRTSAAPSPRSPTGASPSSGPSTRRSSSAGSARCARCWSGCGRRRSCWWREIPGWARARCAARECCPSCGRARWSSGASTSSRSRWACARWRRSHRRCASGSASTSSPRRWLCAPIRSSSPPGPARRPTARAARSSSTAWRSWSRSPRPTTPRRSAASSEP